MLVQAYLSADHLSSSWASLVQRGARLFHWSWYGFLMALAGSVSL